MALSDFEYSQFVIGNSSLEIGPSHEPYRDRTQAAEMRQLWPGINCWTVLPNRKAIHRQRAVERARRRIEEV
jgi:hypothetical protein